MDSISLAQARRIALAAQGLHRPRAVGAPPRPTTQRPGAAPPGSGSSAGPAPQPSTAPAGPNARRAIATVRRMGLVQIDSVNVLARAHLMPLYSRLGPYDTAVLDRASSRAPRRLVEAWAHEASYIPVETYPLLAWRRRASATEAWRAISGVARSHPEVVAAVRDVVAATGPVTAREVQVLFEAEHPRTTTDWGWNWSVAKRALELLFFTGEVAAAGRNASFERRYDLTERVLPPAVRDAAPVGEADSVRELLAIGARAHGIGTLRCFQDYFRLRGPAVRIALSELVEAGTVRQVRVRGWDRTTYLHADAAVPRRASGATLLSPFDPLVFERSRVEALFGMRYRIEIYTPAHRRVHGYYVLPFLEAGALTARVDLKAARESRVLRVQSAWGHEPTADTPARLAAELRLLAGWLGLDRIEVTRAGDLARSLHAELAPGGGSPTI